jgi:hypothetical protein
VGICLVGRIDVILSAFESSSLQGPCCFALLPMSFSLSCVPLCPCGPLRLSPLSASFSIAFFHFVDLLSAATCIARTSRLSCLAFHNIVSMVGSKSNHPLGVHQVVSMLCVTVFPRCSHYYLFCSSMLWHPSVGGLVPPLLSCCSRVMFSFVFPLLLRMA